MHMLRLLRLAHVERCSGRHKSIDCPMAFGEARAQGRIARDGFDVRGGDKVLRSNRGARMESMIDPTSATVDVGLATRATAAGPREAGGTKVETFLAGHGGAP